MKWIADWLARRRQKQADQQAAEKARYDAKLEEFFVAAEAQLELVRKTTGKCLLGTGVYTSIGERLCELPQGHDGEHSTREIQ